LWQPGVSDDHFAPSQTISQIVVEGYVQTCADVHVVPRVGSTEGHCDCAWASVPLSVESWFEPFEPSWDVLEHAAASVSERLSRLRVTILMIPKGSKRCAGVDHRESARITDESRVARSTA
jgi:hypothetical protein